MDSRDITGSWTQVSPNRPNFKFVAKIETRLASVGLIHHLVLKFRGVGWLVERFKRFLVEMDLLNKV